MPGPTTSVHSSVSERDGLVAVAIAAEMLGSDVTEAHIRARLRRGSLQGRLDTDGSWLVDSDSILDSLRSAGRCGACERDATEYVIVKYHHHERVEFSLCEQHGGEATLTYSRQGGVLEVVGYPLQSEGWLKPR